MGYVTSAEESSELQTYLIGAETFLSALAIKLYVSLNTWKDGIIHPKQDMKKPCLTLHQCLFKISSEKLKRDIIQLSFFLSLPAAMSDLSLIFLHRWTTVTNQQGSFM